MKYGLQYPTHDCESMQDHILLYKHDLRSINILQLITTSSDVVDGTLVEVVISCELFLIYHTIIVNIHLFIASFARNSTITKSEWVTVLSDFSRGISKSQISGWI